MFGKTFSDKRALLELRRIADSLELIAGWIARSNNIQWTPSSARKVKQVDEEPELFHTSDAEMLAIRLKEYSTFMGEGDRDE